MKTSDNDVQKLKKLFTALKKGCEKPKKTSHCDFIETLVFAILCENTTEAAARAAIKKIQSHFVDFNDLRVARIEEIVEAIGHDIPGIEKYAAKLVALLNAIFQKYDCLSPEDMTNAGKKNTREILEKFNGMTDFVRAYIMMMVLNAHVVPMTEKMTQYLKTVGIIDSNADNVQAETFIEKHISAAEVHTFYALIRHDSELANPKAAQILADDKSKSAVQKKNKPKK
jgi:endonuclease III